MTSPETTTAHQAILAKAQELEQQGLAPASIVDALLVIGINSGIKVSDPEHMAKFLERMAAEIRAGRTVTGTRH